MKVLFGYDLRKALYDIIDEADKVLVIVSPYIKLANSKGKWIQISTKLKEKCKEGIVKIHTRSDYYDNNERKVVDIEELSKIFNGISRDNIYLHKYLHAKLYFNDNKALITSMNLLDSSLEKSTEIGYLIDDKNEYNTIKEQFYEKYLIVPHKWLRANIERIEKNILNDTYDLFIYEPDKIIIENKKNGGTLFTIECSIGRYHSNTDYELVFEIIFNDEPLYKKAKEKFENQFNRAQCPIFSYKEDNNTIHFSSEPAKVNWSDEELKGAPFVRTDIRNVFYVWGLYDFFSSYVNQIIKTLENILFKNENDT
jgi:phosphatidylserine/phosphatidylglycerophosphate/cardiolipin synthase-like enzyme